MQAFHHCIGQRDATLPSPRYLIEEAAHLTQETSKPAPKFDTSRLRPATPQQPRPPLVLEGHGTTEKADESEPDPHSAFPPFFPSHTSHHLMQQHLDHQRRAIVSLRSNLLERRQKETQEKKYVEKLRKALQQSLEYCSKAGDWQERESFAMRQVIQDLKTEVGTLMAHLLAGEDEKIRARENVTEMLKQSETHAVRAEDLEKQVALLKEKLHESFKDFLAVNEKYDRMSRAIEHGSETIRQRNDTLRKNLEKMSQEYDTKCQILANADRRIQDLEAELEEMAAAFNLTGASPLDYCFFHNLIIGLKTFTPR
jgi:hypothetical protein